ncbi:type III secretion system effector avirulence protein AvrBs2 [Xanthomonas phaseoli]|uniref:type III secretion system effector avirulence protein AvrBs2 n=1 Tax=Xanthomonas phaseoli TaxID=1985254 RepID=UPI00035C5380|nr:type III secretion system effector avirulence protein AvrBs2 [Xanthomonas phaseoli]MCC8533874.1 glycerophosphodiester phosphodiesterase family protein [Xanthomonas phaseoli]
MPRALLAARRIFEVIMRIGPLQPSVAHTAAPALPTHTTAISPTQVPHMPGNTPPLRERPRRRAGNMPPLVPLNGSAMTGRPALVALDSEFSEQRLAEVQARQITVQTLQTKLATHLAQAGTAPKPDSIAARFAAGTLEPVYLDTAAFNAMSRGLPARARAAAGPVLIDAQQGRIIFNLQRAFAPGDTFSDAALAALGKQLNLSGHGLATPDWLQPAAGTPGRRKALMVPKYRGHQIPAQDGGAGFYKPDDHRLLEGKTKQMQEHLKTTVHANYLRADSTRAIGKDVMVHRGLYDFHHGIPENSLSAIDNAYAKGYRTVELDVEVSADGVPMLLHDFTVGRTLDLPDNRLVADVPYAELRDQPIVIRNPVDGNFVKTDQRLPSIDQVLRHVSGTKPGMSVVLDCKETTPEDVALMLLSQPQVLPFTAIKLYSSAYKGGFDQLFANLCKRLQINPLHSSDEPRRRKLRNDLSKIKVVPILDQSHLENPEMRAVFPGSDSVSGLADTATGWMQSWNGMHPVIAEAMVAHPDSNAGKAMQEARARLRQPGSGYEEAAFSAAYRFEDFSVAKSDGEREYFTWGIFGEINLVPDDGFQPKRGTAGAFRDQGESVLTDEPNEEVLALREDRTLPRGHTGVELNAPPGTTIDTKRDAALANLRRQEFAAKQRTLDKQSVDAVREGARLDRGAAAQLTPEARAAIDTRAESLGMLTERYRGAPVSHYLNEQAKGAKLEE